MDAIDWSPGVGVCYKVGEDFFAMENSEFKNYE